MVMPAISLGTYKPFDLTTHYKNLLTETFNGRDLAKKVMGVVLSIIFILPLIIIDLAISAVSLIYRCTCGQPIPALAVQVEPQPIVEDQAVWQEFERRDIAAGIRNPPEQPRQAPPVAPAPQVARRVPAPQAVRANPVRQDQDLNNRERQAAADLLYLDAIRPAPAVVAEPPRPLPPIERQPLILQEGVLNERATAHALHLFGMYIREPHPAKIHGLVVERTYLKKAVEEAFQFLSPVKEREYKQLLHSEFNVEEGRERPFDVKNWIAECSIVHYLVKKHHLIHDMPAYLERLEEGGNLEALADRFAGLMDEMGNLDPKAKLILQVLVPESDWHLDWRAQVIYDEITELAETLTADSEFVALARQSYPIGEGPAA
jgi:hypothetical protein